MKRCLILFSILLFPLHCIAGDKAYSSEYNRCLEKAQGATVRMLHCNEVELKKQDAAMAAVYKKVMVSLKGAEKQAVLDSQRIWIKHKEASCGLYTKLSNGTMYTAIESDCLLNETLARKEFLADILMEVE